MSYRRFADLMASSYPNHKWEPLTVTTSDNYELTLFHVWNEQARNEIGAQGPILFQHGDTQDGTIYLENGGQTDWNPGTAAPIQFADLGYDIYLGNNRGTEYS